jgi:hypothetical protein
MKTYKVKSMDAMVAKARGLVERALPGYRPEHDRKWLVAVTDSYGKPQYRTELHTFEGSPAKGFVVVDRSWGVAMAFDDHRELIGQIHNMGCW